MLYLLALSISAVAGLMSIAVFFLGLKESPLDDRRSSSTSRKKSRNLLVWAVLFLGSSFGGLEWSFYLLGYNMFTFFAFPLAAYFAVWFGFVIWVFERIHERRIWVAFLIALMTLTVIALSCMNCLAVL